MKFISWNINGLNSCIKNGRFEEAFEKLNADFFCIQEIKNNSKIDIKNTRKYLQFWNFSEIKRGYSGTVIFCKKEPTRSYYGIEDEYGENFDKEGRVITLEYSDFFLVNCYVPNTKTGAERLNYRLKFDEIFKNYIEKLNLKKNVIICGDFNVAYKEIDICKEFRVKSYNNDTGFFDEEKIAFEDLINLGLIDTFRYFHPQQQKYSWYFDENNKKNNIGGRLDYFLISNELANNIEKAEIHDEILGSDHLPIELELKLEE